MLRRNVLSALGFLPFLGFVKQPPASPRVEIPEATVVRLAEVLIKGGKITSVTYYIPEPDKYRQTISGTMFFTKPEERDWKLGRR